MTPVRHEHPPQPPLQWPPHAWAAACLASTRASQRRRRSARRRQLVVDVVGFALVLAAVALVWWLT